MISIYTERYQRLLEKLQNARRDAGLTQVEVAEAFGKPQSFVSKCESGERRIDVVELGAFAGLYRKPLAYFVAEVDPAGGAGLLTDRASQRHDDPGKPAGPSAQAARKSARGPERRRGR